MLMIAVSVLRPRFITRTRAAHSVNIGSGVLHGPEQVSFTV